MSEANLAAYPPTVPLNAETLARIRSADLSSSHSEYALDDMKDIWNRCYEQSKSDTKNRANHEGYGTITVKTTSQLEK